MLRFVGHAREQRVKLAKCVRRGWIISKHHWLSKEIVLAAANCVPIGSVRLATSYNVKIDGHRRERGFRTTPFTKTLDLLQGEDSSSKIKQKEIVERENHASNRTKEADANHPRLRHLKSHVPTRTIYF